MSPPRQGVILWEIPNTPELPETTQTRCRELLLWRFLKVTRVCFPEVTHQSCNRGCN
jgi:hypothetical protein